MLLPEMLATADPAILCWILCGPGWLEVHPPLALSRIDRLFYPEACVQMLPLPLPATV